MPGSQGDALATNSAPAYFHMNVFAPPIISTPAGGRSLRDGPTLRGGTPAIPDWSSFTTEDLIISKNSAHPEIFEREDPYYSVMLWYTSSYLDGWQQLGEKRKQKYEIHRSTPQPFARQYSQIKDSKLPSRSPGNHWQLVTTRLSLSHHYSEGEWYEGSYDAEPCSSPVPALSPSRPRAVHAEYVPRSPGSSHLVTPEQGIPPIVESVAAVNGYYA